VISGRSNARAAAMDQRVERIAIEPQLISFEHLIV
jgi:hypothetical protein